MAIWYQAYQYKISEAWRGTFLPEASCGFPVLLLPASVCACVSQSRVWLHDNCLHDHSFKLGSPNFDHRYERPQLGSYYFMESSTLTFMVKFNLKVQIYPHQNSSPFQARISKLRPEVQNTLVNIFIVFGGNWPRPSRSNSTWKSKCTVSPQQKNT